MIHIFERFLPKKKTDLPSSSTSESESDSVQKDELQDEGPLSDAERIASTVAEGLEGGDYAAMGAELTALAPEKPSAFVFEPDGVLGSGCEDLIRGRRDHRPLPKPFFRRPFIGVLGLPRPCRERVPYPAVHPFSRAEKTVYGLFGHAQV